MNSLNCDTLVAAKEEKKPRREGRPDHYTIGLRNDVCDVFTHHTAKPAFLAVRSKDAFPHGYGDGS